jgi:hypothetical protein
MAESSGLSQVIFRLSQHDIAGEVNLKPQAWRVLTAIDGSHTIAEVAQSVGLGEEVVAGIVEMLFKSGFLEIAPGSPPMPRPTLDAQVLANLSKELTLAMGPMAEIILDEEIAALGEKRDQFPVERLPELVERLSASIRVDAKRVQFQQTMLDFIRRTL